MSDLGAFSAESILCCCCCEATSFAFAAACVVSDKFMRRVDNELLSCIVVDCISVGFQEIRRVPDKPCLANRAKLESLLLYQLLLCSALPIKLCQYHLMISSVL